MRTQARTHRAGFILLSTSRVYSIAHLAALRVDVNDGAYRLADGQQGSGVSDEGVSEEFSTEPPLSLYGATKLASERLALEYGAMFDFPVWINRCGVLAGAGQFGRIDQGIFAYWIHSWAARRRLAYIGFDGLGHQVRDCLHPRDLVPLLEAQIASGSAPAPRVVNASGGLQSSCALQAVSEWCADRFGPHQVVASPEPRPFDIPWLVLDSRLAHQQWSWSPATSREAIFEEIAQHAERHPNWLEMSDD